MYRPLSCEPEVRGGNEAHGSKNGSIDRRPLYFPSSSFPSLFGRTSSQIGMSLQGRRWQWPNALASSLRCFTLFLSFPILPFFFTSPERLGTPPSGSVLRQGRDPVREPRGARGLNLWQVNRGDPGTGAWEPEVTVTQRIIGCRTWNPRSSIKCDNAGPELG